MIENSSIHFFAKDFSHVFAVPQNANVSHSLNANGVDVVRNVDGNYWCPIMLRVFGSTPSEIVEKRDKMAEKLFNSVVTLDNHAGYRWIGASPFNNLEDGYWSQDVSFVAFTKEGFN